MTSTQPAIDQPPSVRRRRSFRLRALGFVAFVAACAIGFLAGHGGGADLGRAAAEGARQGLAAGTGAGRRSGYLDGYNAGQAEGYAAEYARGYAQRAADARAAQAARAQRAKAPAPAPATPASSESPQEVAIRDCTNAQRVLHGLSPLAEDSQLNAAAHSQASNMLHYNFFDHTDPWGRGIEQRVAQFAPGRSWTLLGENIAAGQSDPAAACRSWMQSPGHRANILEPGFRKIGTGFAAGASGYQTYYVEDFGAP